MSLQGVIFELVLFGILCCVGVGLLLYTWHDKRWPKRRMDKFRWWGYLVMIVLVYIALCASCIHAYNNTHTEYLVEIGEDISFHEFHNKWEVVSQEGEYYRIKEK